jgi:hypothetical protein
MVQALAPQWLKKGAHAGALMFRPEYIAASEALGISLRDAWTVHGGYADCLCAESEQMASVYRSEGVPSGKVVLTGTPYLDTVFDACVRDPAARGALRKPRRIQPDVMRILISWPPSYHAERGGLSEFGTYSEMCREVLGGLKALPHTRLTLSLHPAVQGEDLAAVRQVGIEPTSEYVVPLIAQHDVYFTYFSSTIRWAVAAGKPVLNYDAYRLDLDVYARAPGVHTSPVFEELRNLALAWCTSPGAYDEAAQRQVEQAEFWGALDGKCNERILAEIDAA